MNDKIPYLVACTAHIDQNTKKSSIESGFEIILEVPIKIQNIIDHVIPKIMNIK